MSVIHETELRSPKIKLLYFSIILVLSIGLVIQFVPLYLMITGAFKTNAEIMQIPPVWFPKQWNFAEIGEIFTKYDMTKNFYNTAVLCTGVICVQVTISALAAYSLSKLSPKWGKAILMFFLATMMFSPQALLFPLYIMLTNVPFIHVNLINTKLAYILATSAWAYAIFLFKGFFDNTPKALLEAARIDGAGNMKIFASIMLPLSKPIFAVVILNTFMSVYNDFLMALMLLPDESQWTIMIRLYSAQEMGGLPPKPMYVMLTIATLPVLAIYMMAQKYLVEGISMTGLKG